VEKPDRREPPFVGDERELLEGFLDYYRDTLLLKCAGLSDEQLRTRGVEPSTLTLLGLVRHMTSVEQRWFQQALLGRDVNFVYGGARNREKEFHDVLGESSGRVERNFLDVCSESRVIARAHDLEELARSSNPDERVTLRWIYLHMIEEYARHCGHADLLRERLDGETGD
jgi:hypothetical protein